MIVPAADVRPTPRQAEILGRMRDGAALAPGGGEFHVAGAQFRIGAVEVKLLRLRGWVRPDRDTAQWWRATYRISDAGLAVLGSGEVAPRGLAVPPAECGVYVAPRSDPAPQEWDAPQSRRTGRHAARGDRNRRRL